MQEIKKLRRFFVSMMVVGFSLLATTNGLATTIDDNYTGFDDHWLGDVIGDPSLFNILSMEVTLTGSILQVDIKTNFAGRGDDGLFSGYTNNNLGIGYGDLFLSSSWDPYGSSPYQNDDHSTGTVWTYGFSLLGDNWASTGGTGALYKFTGGSNDANALLSNEMMSGATYRNGQEVLVDNLDNQTFVRNGTWTIDEINSIVGFTIDISGTDLYTGSEIALHWGPTCANDVIEGSVPVPEPSTLLLLGTGLLGLFAFNRKKKQFHN